MASPAAAWLGQRVRALRTAQGMSQEEFAQRVGIDRSYMGVIERGGRNLSLEKVVAIAHALGLTPSELLEGLS
jgi:transcriptional regulator with XRE-family HTH domain